MVNSTAPCRAAPPDRTPDIQFNAAGADSSFGVLQVWADGLTGKNSPMIDHEPNDGSWNARYNLSMGLYFSGDLVTR